MKQDQSYFEQVFYLREDNFGLKIKKNVALKITCKIVAFVYRKLSFSDAVCTGGSLVCDKVLQRREGVKNCLNLRNVIYECPPRHFAKFKYYIKDV